MVMAVVAAAIFVATLVVVIWQPKGFPIGYTALIGAVIVYFLSIGEVKGFAFTMGLTTAFDLVVSFLVMAPLMQLIGGKPAAAKPAMNGLGGIYALVEERRARGYYAKTPAAGKSDASRLSEEEK